MSYFDGNILDRMNLLRSWSRHSNFDTPKSMKGVWRTSYQSTFNGKKIGFNPDRVIVDYFTGQRQIVPSRASFTHDRFKTSLNERARNGFRYWVLEKPKTTNFGKYGTGAYKTVLGVGNAPRT
ncbi:uncharacterized protein LOC127869117 isoform X1 [Dreissena polymorpha]|uniref:Uncharacterized protein n=1 Tax=Dreissena polymorpha TaxID=45954 RepID=A0A9D4RS25_DREPO|nr:uncharacterized protein LOC127869117 isoform X1 [Dreissena polymorpha]KAH3876630.1 hypothetical protein DPMN_000477 [Dreissena polymorpha]